MIGRAGRSGLLHGAAALAALLLSLALFWPGVALYDSVDQYRQALGGLYDDWHPPVMARLWSLLLGAWPATAPMLILQLGLYWLGLGLLAAACARRGRPGAGWAILAAGAATLLSCWMGAILKDGQMVGALAAVAGILGWFRLGERRVPAWAAALALLLLLYAVLVRANAVFAVVPLGLALFGWAGLRSPAARAALGLGAAAAILLLAPLVNHELLGAERSGVENSLLAYDVAGTAIRARAGDVAGVPPERWAQAVSRGCYSPHKWDRLGQPECLVDARLAATPESRPVYRLWLATILRHPVAYAQHRLAHFNATMRLFVPRNLPIAMSPVDPEPNALGLGVTPGDIERAFWTVGGLWAGLPPGWPAFWLALGSVALWPAVRAPAGPERDPALALLLSACCGGFSYALVSVASDLRYHLWTMLAAPVGIALLAASGAIRRRYWVALAATAAAVTVTGIAGRLLLAPLPVPV
ncbi:MAG: hypothetical protein QOH81_545 [Sphingomonadales bacterium]|jgi:hypothetical protein|nr:hypothetical protein [Sphingomonadales bacterium]